MGFKIFWSVMVLALVIAIIGAATNSPPIAVGVAGGLIVCVFTFIIIFKAKANFKKDLENETRGKHPL